MQTDTEIRFEPLIRALLAQPWAIMPEKLREIAALLALRAAGGAVPEEVRAYYLANTRSTDWYLREIAADGPSAIEWSSEALAAAAARGQAPAQGIAVLPLFGVIAHRAGSMSESSGGTSTERFAQQFRQAVASPAAAAVIIDIDSPGGGVDGITELASEIYSARNKKPVIAIANSLAASAAYWLGSAATELVATPSGQVGSIGVFAAHEDISKALEAKGVNVSLISAGKYKTEGHPYGPLSDEARAAAQDMVNGYYAQFVGDVARNRDVSVDAVQRGFGQGRVVMAQQAFQLGMVDGVETFDDVVVRLSSEAGRRQVMSRTSGRAQIVWAPAALLARDRELLAERDSALARELGWAASQAAVIPPHDSPSIAADDETWDGPAEVAAAEGEAQLRRMHAWVDSEGDPEAKASYKLPHHKHDTGALVPAGLHAAAGRLEQTDLPAADVPGVRRHLAHHYDELGEEAPWAGTASHSQPGPEGVEQPLLQAGQDDGDHTDVEAEDLEFRRRRARAR